MRPLGAVLTRSWLSRMAALARPFDACAQLYWDDPAAFAEERRTASMASLPEPFISLAMAEHAFWPLKNGQLHKLARRLCSVGRHAQALALLSEPRPGSADDPIVSLLSAVALAGLGRMVEAAAAARRAHDFSPASPETGPIVRRLDELAGLESAALASRLWPPQAAYLDSLMEFGAFGAAFSWLRRRLASGGLTLDADGVKDAHANLGMLLVVLGEADAYGVLRALAPYHPDPAATADLARITTVLLAPADAPAPGGWTSQVEDLHLSGALAWAAAGRTKAAITGLGALSRARPKDFYVRARLALAIQTEVLAAHPIRFRPDSDRRIFDIFPFNDELELLDIKFGVMAGWVDHFVLVEARETFTGRPKPLHFQANEARFAAYRDKIIHVVIDRFPDHIDSAWARDFYQRDMAIQGLSGLCAEQDLVLFTDADEIIVESAVRSFDGEQARLLQERSRYFLNYREVLTRDQQRGAVSVWRAKYLRTISPSHARFLFTQEKKAQLVHDAGWHFTSVKDVQGIIDKLKNTAHQEWADANEDKLRRILDGIRQGKNEPGWERCELDERFPDYVRAARAELANLIL